jgi:hypothetical protein
MSTGILVQTREMARRRKLTEDWYYVPEDREGGGERLTLRGFITRVVVQKVKEFHERQEARKFVRALSERQIEAGAARGKIDMGGEDLQQQADPDSAVATAIQGFEDKLYMVIIDGLEQTELDREIYLRPESKVVFLRLVMLAGGW